MPDPDRTARQRPRPSAEVAPASAQAAAPPLADTLAAWAAQAPVALCLVGDDGRIDWINAAFEALTGFSGAQALGAPVQTLLAAPLSAPWSFAAGPTQRRVLHRRDGGALPCDVHCSAPAAGRWMLSLVDRRDEQALSDELQHLQQRLDFVQDCLRVGTWERDIHGLPAQWDADMLGRGGPSAGGGAGQPQDGLAQVFRESLAGPGRHAHRFRLQAGDGSVRRLQAHWEVRAAPDGTPARVVGLVMDDTATYALAASHEAANAQLRLALELGGLAFWRHDLHSGRMHYDDRAFEVLEIAPRPDGLTLDEVRALIHPDDLPEVVACAERALASHQPEDMQARYRRADGSWRHVLTRRVTQRDEQGRPIAFNGVALDITDQVERGQRSGELARQLEDLAAAAGIGLWRLPREGTLPDWNAQMFALCGLPPDGPALTLREWIARCVHPEDRERVRQQAIDWTAGSDRVAEVAHRLQWPDGQVRHVVNRGRVEPADSRFQFCGVMIDVTERERALAALRQANERSALATRAAGIGIWEWDLDTDVSHWDAQMYRLRGLAPRAQAPGLAEMTGFVHPDDREHIAHEIRMARRENRGAYYEFRILRPDGRTRWLASRSMPMPLREDDGTGRVRLGVNWDITEARDAEAARQERALALRESRAKSELLARMSHELRTPMNAVLGFTQLLLADQPDSTSPQHQRLAHIRSAGEHLMTLIDDVLEVSRPDGTESRIEMQAVDVDALMARTLPMVERLALQHGVTLGAAPAGLQVRGDPTRLTQVLTNLLTNAIKYNRVGGTVQVSSALQDGRAVLRVADTGVGMTAAECALAFEPFERAGAAAAGIEGTGIGLTITRTLVQRMGGRMALRSVPGEGSVFEVWLELARDGHVPAQAALPLLAEAEAVPQVRRLLYIEDNPVNVLIVSELVRRRGDIHFDSAADGLGGVALATRTLPALVLVDMQLPDINGLEVLARLRGAPATATLPCVALSANAVREDIDRALAAGFDDYWTKPLDFAMFEQALSRVFGPVGG